MLECRAPLAAFPAFSPAAPLGSLVYTSSVVDTIETNVTDEHQLLLSAGQRLSIALQPNVPELRPSIEFLGPNDEVLGTATAPTAGDPAVLQNVTLPQYGTYRIRVEGADDSIGDYRALAVLNAAVEAVDSDLQNPLALDATQYSSTVPRLAAFGLSDPPTNDVEIFSESFDGPSSSFEIDNAFGSGNGLWHVSTGRQADGLDGHTPPRAMYFGQNETLLAGGDYAAGGSGGAVISPPVQLPEMRSARLHFSHFLETEGSPDWDVVEVAVDSGAGFVTIASSADGSLPTGTDGQWEEVQLDVSPLAGQEVRFRFSFDTIDGAFNTFEGWFLDDVRVISPGFAEEVDVYSVDLTGLTGEPVDIVLAGAVGDDFSAATLELFGADPDVPLAIASRSPLGIEVTNFELGLLDFVVPDDGIYTLRVTNSLPGTYAVVVTPRLMFEAEPNDDAASANSTLRELTPDRKQVLGHVSPPTSTLPSEVQTLDGSTTPVPAEKAWSVGRVSAASLAFLPEGTTPVEFARTYGNRFERTRNSSTIADGSGVQQTPLMESEPNDSFEDANFLPLGLDPALGELTAIEIAGTISTDGTPVDVDEPDSSIPEAHDTELTANSVYRARSSITTPDGPIPIADYDWFRILNVQPGQEISVDIDAAASGSTLDSVVGIYNSSGQLLAFNDDANGVDSFLKYAAPFPGTYYVVVRGYGLDSGFQPDPFSSTSGTAPGTTGNYTVSIGLDVFDEVDTFRLSLEAGDVLGVGLAGGVDRITLFNAQENLLMQSDQDLSFIFPDNSPLGSLIPNANSTLTWVIDTTADYYVRVDRGAGNYNLNFRVFRPPLETQPDNAKQVLFLDFDGEDFDASILGGNPNASLSPLSSFLPNWGLNPQDDLNAVIDSIVAVVTENLSDDIRERGGNGDFAASGVFGEFDIEIRNSRDHADPFGEPNVSRVLIGGTIPEIGIGTIGIAESIDVGNFDREETAVVLLDLLSASRFNPNSLNRFVRGPNTSIIDVIGLGVGIIATHEAGHFFGNWHTDQFNSTPNIMDQGGNLANTIGLVGPVLGDGDDRDVDFGPDVFVPNEGFVGVQQTLEVISFGLPSGGVIRGPVVESFTPIPGPNPNLYVSELTMEFSRTLSSDSAVMPENYEFLGAGEDEVFGTADDVQPAVDIQFDGNRQVVLDLQAPFDPLPAGDYRLTVKSTLLDALGRRLNARVDAPEGLDTIHNFSIVVPSVGDRYLLDLATDQTVTLEVNSFLESLLLGVSTLDAELLVFRPDGTLLANNAGSPTMRDPRIEFTAGSAGIYEVLIAASSGQGAYVLTTDLVAPLDGDFDNDGDFDCDDINALTAAVALGSGDPTLFDLDGNGLVDNEDVTQWLAEAGSANLGPGRSYLRGDADLSGAVDGSDFSAWNGHRFTVNTNWCDGNFNADTLIDGADFSIWNTNKFTASPAGNSAFALPIRLHSVAGQRDGRSIGDRRKLPDLPRQGPHQTEESERTCGMVAPPRLTSLPATDLQLPARTRLAVDHVFAMAGQRDGLVGTTASRPKTETGSGGPTPLPLRQRFVAEVREARLRRMDRQTGPLANTGRDASRWGRPSAAGGSCRHTEDRNRQRRTDPLAAAPTIRSRGSGKADGVGTPRPEEAVAIPKTETGRGGPTPWPLPQRFAAEVREKPMGSALRGRRKPSPYRRPKPAAEDRPPGRCPTIRSRGSGKADGVGPPRPEEAVAIPKTETGSGGPTPLPLPQRFVAEVREKPMGSALRGRRKLSPYRRPKPAAEDRPPCRCANDS